ncbi:MAG: YihY/virulence factor BrkB family protein [Bacteroidota bacterium]
MQALIKKIIKFFEKDLWRIRTKRLPRYQRYPLEFLKIWFIAIKEFVDDRCAEKASALTFLSMLSLVPVLALVFAIAKAFKIGELVNAELNRYFKGQTEILNAVRPYVDKILDTEGGGIVAISSAVFLIYTVIRLLMNIEDSFNNMWDIKQNRRWERKISDYVAVILLGPILVIIAGTSTVFVQNTIQDFIADFDFLGQLRSGIGFLLKFLPYTILWLLLSGLYLIFPNTRVKLWPALLGGIIGGTLYQLNQQAFISFQFAFARYDAIYGSIAILPLFLIWLQISWLLVLFGAEICYATQYMNQWELNKENLNISYLHKKKLMLLILYRIIKRFEDKEGGTTVDYLNEKVNVPRRFILDIIYELEKSGLIVKLDNEFASYQPSFDVHKMDLHTILSTYESQGLSDFDPRKSESFKKIEKQIELIENKWIKSKENILLKEL